MNKEILVDGVSQQTKEIIDQFSKAGVSTTDEKPLTQKEINELKTVKAMKNADTHRGNARMEGESFEEYKERREIVNLMDKYKSKGKIVWNSLKDGQFIKNV